MVEIFKLLHVLFVFVWMGTLLALTRLFVSYVKEEPPIQLRLSLMFRRLYFFVDLPSMLLAIGFGVALLFLKKIDFKAAWFHMKMTFVLLLIASDVFCGRIIVKLCRSPMKKRVFKYRLIHMMGAVFLIGALSSIYIIKQRL